MKTMNLEGMEKIQGGDCFDTMFAAAGSFWDCFGSNGSGGACAVATAYIFYLMDSCYSI